MQYMLLIYSSPASEPTYGTAEFQAMMAGFSAFNDKAGADGVLRGGEALKPIDTATSVRVRGGKVETMDGPFAETREHLGGYFIVNVPNLDVALEWAARAPNTATGTTEVRPVLDVPDLDTALRYAALIPAAQFGTIEVRPLMDYNPANT